MQNDEIIWQVLRHNHCSFMSKNPYNVSGVCNRSSCPLANSRYATILDLKGVLYLYMKTVERAHRPKELWERVKLPRNYERALEMIDKHLIYWPKKPVHMTKQRLTKQTQIRMRERKRKLALKTREEIKTMPRMAKKREARREEKAEKAAVLEKSIENEVLRRLEKGVYGDQYSHPVEEFDKVLGMELQEAASEEEEEEGDVGVVEYVEDCDLEEEYDMEDFAYLDDDDIPVRHEEEEVMVIARNTQWKDSVNKFKKPRVLVEVRTYRKLVFVESAM
uniref:Protein MAK16 homolog n=1 Tax=Kalanchoe fedtschenkoi TaxID=63787 RepID=A0A7N0TEY4_KALFE